MGETRSRAHSQCVLTPGFAALHTHLDFTSTQQTRGCASSQLDTLRTEGRPQRPPRKVLLQGRRTPCRAQSPGWRVGSSAGCPALCSR